MNLTKIALRHLISYLFLEYDFYSNGLTVCYSVKITFKAIITTLSYLGHEKLFQFNGRL